MGPKASAGGKRATAGSNSKGPAGPAKAHVLIAALSLPPGVPGEVKGEVVVCVDALHWKYRQPPAQVQLRICWWGAPEGTDAVVPFHASRGAGAAFPITSGPRFLIRYLRDMGNLSVSIEECPSARVIGTVSLDTSQVDVSRPLELSVPCLGANKQVLAIADVSLCIRYSQLLSSFEMAEHLASADKALPLYPLASLPNSRHQPAAGGAAAVGAAAAAATTTVITGAIPSAARLADTAPAAATGRHGPATKSEQQQQQLQQWAASPAETQQASLDPPKDATSGHHSAALCDTGTAATVSAVGLSAAGAAGTAGGQQQQQQLDGDPLLEVIRKAEQLKQSLDQAAKAGVMLGLLPSIQQPHHGVQQQYAAVPSLQAQPHQQQQQQMRSPLQAAGSPSLLTRARIQSPGAPRALLLGPAAPTPAAAPAGHSGSGGYSRSLLTAGELLAALAPAMPAGHAAAAPGNQLHDQHEGSHGRHAARGRRHHQHALLRAAAAGSSSDDERSSSSSTHTASSRGSSGSSSSGRSHHSSLLAELDGLEELEDLLLQELLNIRAPTAPARHKAARQKASPHRGKAAGQQHQQQDQQQHGDQQPVKQQPAAAGEGVNLGATAAAAAGQGQVARKEGTQQQGLPLQQAAAAGASLHVNLVSVHGLPAVPSTLTAVIKCAGQQQTLDITALMQQPSTPQRQQQHEHTQQAGMGAAGGVVSSCSQDSCSTTLAVPAGLLQPLAGQHPFLVVEVWAGEPVVSQAKGAAAVLASSHLLGIVRVPLQLPSQQQQQQALAAHMQYLTGGAYPVYDILQGQAVGTLELSMHLLGPAEPAASAAAAAAAAVAIATEGATAVAGATAGTAAAATVDASDAVAAEGQAVSAGVLGVRHVIDVTLVRASGLPVATDLAAMQQPIPDKRFVKYSFPGDEPLYTQEVECVSEPVFAAHARHTVLLQPGESVTECFAGEPGTPEDLLFEVYDKWPDDSDSLAVVGSLPLEQVLSLCQAHASSSAAAGDIPSTATVLVPLYPERAAAQPAARPVNLQVSVSYSCSPCWALEGPEDELQVAGPEGCREATPGGQQQQLLKAAQPQQQDQDQGQLDVQRQMQQGGCCPNPMPAEPPQAPLPPSGLGFGRGSEDSLSSQKYPPVTHDSAAAGQQQDSRAGPVGKNAVGPGYEAGVSAAAAAGADSMKPAAAAADPVPPMLAELCVKVVRACGLQAAVKEAEGWLGNASGLLGRARQLGPHPYVTVALMPGSSTVPAVRTPFQAQTFCPQFHYQHVLPIRLDPSTLTALASSDACVELWHHCPRSQAVAAALSRGLSSSYAMAGQQQVFLGSAALPLQGLLIYPQGICRWVVLRSQLGAPVAAVQLEVSFTHIGGTPVGNSPAAMPPLLRHPEWLELLPAAAASRLSGYAALPPSGFSGQWVQLSVHVEELLLPGGDDAALERPKIASYIATLRLPGSSCEHSTQSKACSSHAATSNLLARSWHVDWKFCTHTWAVADARLAAALLGYPLVLAVYKQEPSRGPVGAGAQGQQGLMVKGRGTVGSGRGQAAEGPALVPCGSVEVDLSPLLAKRPGSSAPGCRWLSGTYPVIHPLSKALGNTRLRLKVLLELEPQDTPSEAWLEAHPQAHWQPSGALAALSTTAAAAAAAQDTTLTERAAAVGALSGAEHQPAATAGVAAAVAGEGVDMQQQQQQAAELVEVPGDVPCSAEAQAAQESGPQQQQHQDSSSRAAIASVDASSFLALATGAACTGVDSGGGDAVCNVTPQLPVESRACSGGRAPVAARLRAEVAHVTAPVGAASPGAIAAASAGAGADAGSISPSLAEPPSQLMLLPAAAATAAAEGAPAGQQHGQQLQLGRALQAFDGRAKLCDVRVCVEHALNLELPDLGEGWLPALFVRYDWPVGGAGVTTPLVTATHGPLARCSQAVKWFHCLHLPLALQSGLEQQRQTQLVTSDAVSVVLGTSPAAVVFQVWCRPVPEAHAAELPPLYAGLSAVPAESDVLLGCAVLDLSALQLLGSVDGWYNITDMHQQLRGQIKVSLTPLKPLDAPPRPLSHSTNGLQQVLAAWPDGISAAPLSAPATTAMLQASLAQLQQQLEHLEHPTRQQQQQPQQHHGELLEPEWSESATTAMLQGSLEDGLAQLQHHLHYLGHLNEEGEGGASISGQHQRWSLGEFGGAAGMDQVLPGSNSMQESAGAVQELSDAAFMALAAESTAAAEAAAAAVEAVAGASGQPVPPSDSLLEALRSNLEELDKLSEALQERISRTELPDSPTGPTSSLSKALGSMVPSAGAPSNQQPAEQVTGNAAAAPADRLQSFRHVRTLSDDEEFLVAPVGITESEADTDELMGRVDWALAANSDDEHDVPPGPPGGHLVQQQQHPAGASSTPAAMPRGSALQQPLNTEDWMFDIGRSTNSTAAALNAPRASSTSAACAGSSSSLRASSSRLPMHPGQLSPAEAQAAAAAAATRLAQVDAAAAAAAARSAAAAAAAATRGSRGASEAEPAGGPAGSAGRPGDMWDHLAQVEDEDEAAALQRQQRLRQQREQHLAAVLTQLPAAARPAQQQPQQDGSGLQTPDPQQQQQQQLLHDPRKLPDALESRLDALLAEFQVAASGAGAFVGRGPTGPLPQFGGYSQQAQAAAAFGRLEGGGLHAAWQLDDGGDSDNSGDFMPVERVAHVSRSEPPAPQQGAASHQGARSSRGDPDEGEVLPRVAFANSLPPVQDDFVIEYSDGPPRSWLDANRQQRAQQRPPQQQQPTPQAASQQQQQQQVDAAAVGSRVATTGQRLAGFGSRTAAPTTASVAASPLPAAAAAESESPSSGSQSGFVISTIGRRPVGGSSAAPVNIMDEMFSFSRQPSSSSSIHSGSGSIRHPGM